MEKIIENHAYIGAVVGMGAVVTKSVAPGDTIAGNPPKNFLKDS